MSDAGAAQKRPGPLGSPIFGSLRRCFSVMCRSGHRTFVAPSTDLKSGTPNSQFYSLAAPTVSGIGVDIVSIVNMSGALKRFGDRLKNRLFTEAEQQICEEKHTPAVHYSGKFAAKESFLKALQRENRGKIRWREMEVLNSPGGQPYFRFSGTAGKTLEENGLCASVSLSHSGEYAIAFCLIQKS